MQLSILTLTAFLAAVTSASPPLEVDNLCPFDLFLTSANDGANDGVHVLEARTNNAYSSPVVDPQGNQHALTVSRYPDMSSPLQNVYTTGNGITYYSASTIYGDPLKAEGFALNNLGNGFDIVSPVGRTGELANAYTPSNPNGEHAVFEDRDNSGFVLSLCS